MADRYWVGGTGTWDTTNTANWSATDGGAGGASVPSIGGTDNVFFTSNSNVGTGSFTVTIGASVQCNDLTISGLDGAMTLAGTSILSIRGSMSLPATNLTWTQNGGLLFVGTTTYGSNKTITTNGVSIASPVTFNSTLVTSSPTNTLILQDAFTTTSTITLSAGTLNLNDYTLTGTTFTSSASTVRSIAYGSTGVITLTGSGTVWNTSTVTNFSYTGTSDIRLVNSGAVATTITAGAMTVAQAQNFSVTAGTYALTLSSSSRMKNLDFTGFSGSFTLGGTVTIFGDMTLSSTTTSTLVAQALTFGGTSVTQNFTTAGRNIGCSIVLNGTSNTLKLIDAITQTTTRGFTLTSGVFDMNSQTTSLGALTINGTTTSIANGTLNCVSMTQTGNIAIGTGYNIVCSGHFAHTSGTLTINDGVDLTTSTMQSSSPNTRAIAFGTGSLNVTGTGSCVSFGNGNLLTTTGSRNIKLTYAGSTAMTIGAASSNTNPLNYLFTDGTYTLNFSSSSVANNIDFTGFSGTLTITTSATVSLFGDLTFSSTMATGTSTGSIVFSATSGTQLVTSNGIIIRNILNRNGVGGTVQFVDDFTQLSTVAFFFINGTLDLNSKNVTLGVFTIQNGTHALTNGILTCATVTHTSGNLTIGTGYTLTCTGTYTFTAGTITINDSATLTTSIFVSSNGNVRSIAFGTGSIDLTGAGTIWNTGIVTNFSYTGTSKIRLINPGSSNTTLNPGTMSAAQALNFYITAGTYNLTTTTNGVYNSLDFTGFSGTYPQSSNSITVYGNLTFSSTMTSTTVSGNLTFSGSVDSVLTSNGHTTGCKITINKASTNSVTLADAFTSTLAAGFVLTGGTFDTAGYSLTLNTFVSTGALARTLKLKSSTVVITGSGAAAWSTDSTLTMDSATDTSTISMTSASAKTFVGSDEPYYNLNQAGDGALTITGSNSFNNITATTRPSTITLTSGTTQTVANFTLSGTSGNLVTLNSSTAGSPATLSKSSGTVSVSYLSIQDNTATGGATWLASTTYGNVDAGGNSGWNFAAIVGSIITSQFFIFF